jgi:hypothetical protein
MSYSAPNTPNPTLSSQIGYSFTTALNSLYTINNNVTTGVTIISNIPKGVWLVFGNNLAAYGSSGGNLVTTSEVYIANNNSGKFIANAAVDSLGAALTMVVLNPSGTFYSDGSTDIKIILTAKSANTNQVSLTGDLTFVKIA